MAVLVVGSVAFDTVKTSSEVADEVLGGSGTYCAYAASFFAPVWLMSPVGEDLPAEHLAAMRQRGIDTSAIQVVKGGRTFRWVGRYSEDFLDRTTEQVELNVFGDYDTTLAPACRGAEYVFLANGAPQAQKAVVEQLERPRMVLLDTMDHWIENEREALDDVLGHVDGLLVNDEEARLLTGERNLLRAARRMSEMGPRVVLIKKGEHGSLLVADGRPFAVPAWLTETVKDPTGAGDCFGGALIGHLARTGDVSFESLKSAVSYGTVVASFCIEDFSVGRLQALTLEEIEQRRRDFASMVSWS